jgi:hypothetical protein
MWFPLPSSLRSRYPIASVLALEKRRKRGFRRAVLGTQPEGGQPENPKKEVTVVPTKKKAGGKKKAAKKKKK